MTNHEELIALAKGTGLFTDEGCEALISLMMDEPQRKTVQSPSPAQPED
jgi:hypothetical protein